MEQQNDYKFRTTSKEDFISDMGALGFPIDIIPKEAIEAGYYQSPEFCVIWLGKLANPYEIDEEGNPTEEITYIDGCFVDIRIMNPLPEGFEAIFTNTVIDNRFPHRFR